MFSTGKSPNIRSYTKFCLPSHWCLDLPLRYYHQQAISLPPWWGQRGLSKGLLAMQVQLPKQERTSGSGKSRHWKIVSQVARSWIRFKRAFGQLSAVARAGGDLRLRKISGMRDESYGHLRRSIRQNTRQIRYSVLNEYIIWPIPGK